MDLFEQSMSELELLLRTANFFEQICDRESNPSPDDILVKTAKFPLYSYFRPMCSCLKELFERFWRQPILIGDN